MSIQIIGAGLAGLAAACLLTERGAHVVLHEAAKAAGGRARSYFDPQLNCRIDNGNHLLLSGNTATMAFLRRTGMLDSLTGPPRPVFPVINVKSGEHWTLRLNSGRLPWWIFAILGGVLTFYSVPALLAGRSLFGAPLRLPAMFDLNAALSRTPNHHA